MVSCAARSSSPDGEEGKTWVTKRRVVDSKRDLEINMVEGVPSSSSSQCNIKGKSNALYDSRDPWTSWNDYFSSMDQMVRDLNAIDEEIDEAVDVEDYRKASELKKEQAAIEAKDVVLKIAKKFGHAIQQEEYGEAAALRDEGGIGLLGWWVGKEGDDDAQGHLVVVTRDFSRYVAHAFTGYSLARAVGWSSSESAGAMEDVMAQGNVADIMNLIEQDDPIEEEEEGSPVFEVFYRDNDDGGWDHQASVFNSPALRVTGLQNPVDDLSALISAQVNNNSNVISVERGNNADGSDFVRINLANPEKDEQQEESDDDDDDGIHTIDDLVNSLSHDEGDEEEDEMIASSESLSEEDIIREIDHDDTHDFLSALSEMSMMNLSQRVPAELLWQGRDKFALKIDERKQKEIISQQPTGDEPNELGSQSNDSLKEIENMVKNALSATDATISVVDDAQLKQDLMTPAIAGLEGTVSYERLELPPVFTDAFQGIYLGSFGPHGPEVIQVRRTMIDGQEWVEGVKITGDVNVPAGEISFKARVGKENKQSPSGVYPIEYGVQSRYPGQGRVAREGYSSPKWVDGELLTLTKSNPITRGAELGFVFHVEASKKFLLLFERVDDSFFQR
eukprot:jgi/Picre1/33030/NNA_008357.t1